MSESAKPKTEQIVKMTTSDGIDIETKRDIAERSILIKNLLEDLGGELEERIPIPNVCAGPCSPCVIIAQLLNIVARSTSL